MSLVSLNTPLPGAPVTHIIIRTIVVNFAPDGAPSIAVRYFHAAPDGSPLSDSQLFTFVLGGPSLEAFVNTAGGLLAQAAAALGVGDPSLAGALVSLAKKDPSP